MAKFNYQQAKKDGYTDDQITEFLSEKIPNFNVKKAQKDGYSPSEINNFLSSYQPPKKQEPVTLKGAVGSYATGVAGGAGGFLADIKPLLGMLGQYLPDLFGMKSTPELTESISQEYGIQEPQNALERILQQSGEFGGMESLLGTATGGPAGGGLGLAHGSASGALYGGLKELGMDDEWALGITVMMTGAPTVFTRVWPKLVEMFKKGSSFEGAVKSVMKQPPPPPGAATPPPPPGQPPAFPFSGIETETGRRGYEIAEQGLQELQKPIQIREQTSEIRLPKEEGQAKSLVGRVSDKELEASKTSELRMPQEEVEAKPLTGRVRVIDNQIGELISNDKFKSDAQGGHDLSYIVKENAKKERAVVDKAYKRAEQITSSHSDIFPQLASENDNIISELEDIAKRSAGEEAVYQDALALRTLIGTGMEPIEQSASKLMRQANSFSQKVKYELPYVGYKGKIKSMVHGMNQAVIRSLEDAGKNANRVRKADRLYGQWADRFLGDEISPFLEKKILNPESLYRKAISDEGTYRGLKRAVGKSNKAISKVQRGVVEQKIRPYLQNPEKIGTAEFNKDISDIEAMIGKESSDKVKKQLLKEKVYNDAKFKAKKGAERKLPAHKVTAATQMKPKKGLSAKEKIPRTLKSNIPISSSRMTPKTYDQVSEYIGKTADQVETMMNTRSGIKKLKHDLESIGRSDLFDELAKDKAIQILKGDTVFSEKLTGSKIFENINNKRNYDILSEIYGKEAVNAALEDTHKAHKNKMIIDKLFKLGRVGASSVGAAKLYKVFSIFI